eukprot:SAG31_NODE_11865_length_990_cov_1.705948_2_plen_114_part_01
MKLDAVENSLQEAQAECALQQKAASASASIERKKREEVEKELASFKAGLEVDQIYPFPNSDDKINSEGVEDETIAAARLPDSLQRDHEKEIIALRACITQLEEKIAEVESRKAS